MIFRKNITPRLEGPEKFARLIALPSALLLLAVLFAHALPDDRLLSLKDAGHLFLTLKERTAAAFHGGSLPLWDNTTGCGVPLLADPVSQVLYPANLIFLFTSSWQGLKYFVLLHYLLTVFALGFLARNYGVSGPGTLIGGLAFAGCGAIMSFHYNPNWTAGFPWLLFAMAYSRRLIYARGSWGSSALLAICLTLMILSGALELLLACALYAVAESILAVAFTYRDKGASRLHAGFLKGFLHLFVSGGIALLLGACQLLPTLELVWFSFRSIGLTSLEANIWSLHPGRLVELLAPHFFGNPTEGMPWAALLQPSLFGNYPLLSGIYLGVPVTVLSIYGFFILPRRQGWTLTAMAFVTLALAWGETTPIFGLARELLPPMKLFRYPAKIFVLTMIPVAILAAAGANGFLTEAKRNRKVLIGVAIALTCLLLGSTLLVIVFQSSLTSWIEEGIVREDLQISTLEVGRGVRSAFLYGSLVAVVFTFLTWVRRHVSGSIALILLLAIIVLDLGWVNRDLILTADTRTHLSVPQVLPPFEQLERSTGVMRIAQGSSNRVLLLYEPHRLSLMGYRSADSYGSMALGNLSMLDIALRDDPEKALRMKSVLFAMERSEQQQDHPYVARSIDKSLPRAFLVHQVSLALADEFLGRFLARADFDPHREVLLSDAPMKALEWLESDRDMKGATGVQMLVDKPTDVVLQVESDGKAYLVLNDSWYPGWEASVNGESAPIYRANFHFRAVPIPAGRTTVRFTYRPQMVRAGLQVSGISLLLLAWLLWETYLRSRSTWHGRQLGNETAEDV